MRHEDKTLAQLLEEAGIKRIFSKISKVSTHLEYKGKIIEKPWASDCYEVVLREFGIDLTTFND